MNAEATVQALLLDLDGTLLDSAPDLVRALNQVLDAENQAPIPYNKACQWVSHGALTMVCQAFGLSRDNARAHALQQRLVEIYAKHPTRHSRLFEGMDVVLDWVTERGWQWGIVTNKPAWLTNPIVAQLGLKPASVVSGDTLAHSKPHPAPLLYACEQIQVEPSKVIYVGDAQRDIEAGQRAGMRTVAALYGYLGEDDDPAAWGATWMVETPLALRDWLQQQV